MSRLTPPRLFAVALAFVACSARTPLADISNPAERAWAVAGFGADDADSFGEVVGLLSDADADVREAAARALGRMMSPVAVMPLASVARDDENGYVRHAACRSLGQIGSDAAIAPLIALWGLFRNFDDGVTHLSAVDALAEIGADAIGPVIEATYDANWRVRAAAAKTLGKLPRRDASVTALERLLSDCRWMVSSEARYALEKLQSSKP